MTLLRKYLVWLILATVAGLAGALLIYAFRPVSYVSTAQVDVEPHLAESLIPVVPNMGTEEQVATSGVILDGPARALHMTYQKLAKHLTATVTGSTAAGSTATGTANVLTIGCTMRSAAQAQACAASVASTYVAFRNEAGLSGYAQVHRPLVATLVTPATMPTAPAGPGLQVLLPVGALLGLALGVGVMFAREHLDGSVHDRADLERCLDAPVLAAIPRVRARLGRRPLSFARTALSPAAGYRRLRERRHPLAAKAPDRAASLVFCRAPLSPAAEAYRYLRERLHPLVTLAPGRGAVLLVAGARAGEGRTAVAANLAAAFAETGARVILVDADLTRPALSGVFSTGERPGLTDLLAERASLQDAAVPIPDVQGLSVVTVGHLSHQPESIFREHQLTRVFQEMRTQADVVIVDSAPVLTASHAITLARASDLIAMVAYVQRTGRDAVGAAAQQLRSIGPRIIIGVLNGAPSLTNVQAWRATARSFESLAATPAQAPAISPGPAPQRAQNGQRRARVGASPKRVNGSPDIGESIEGTPGSGQGPGE
jgi:succinoglycan biosynthesis transport protein ExoP